MTSVLAAGTRAIRYILLNVDPTTCLGVIVLAFAVVTVASWRPAIAPHRCLG
jgi:hypothetical protein